MLARVFLKSLTLGGGLVCLGLMASAAFVEYKTDWPALCFRVPALVTGAVALLAGSLWVREQPNMLPQLVLWSVAGLLIVVLLWLLPTLLAVIGIGRQVGQERAAIVRGNNHAELLQDARQLLSQIKATVGSESGTGSAAIWTWREGMDDAEPAIPDSIKTLRPMDITAYTNMLVIEVMGSDSYTALVALDEGSVLPELTMRKTRLVDGLWLVEK